MQMIHTHISSFTELHKAARLGDEQLVHRLIQDGADVFARDSEGRTPLHHAVMRGHATVVDQLLNKGGPSLLLTKDILHCTAVHLAAVQNQVILVMRLIQTLLEDTQGKTALHEVARGNCMQDFMGFLHLGWETATSEDDTTTASLEDSSPCWSMVGHHVDLRRPSFLTVQRVLGWQPLHVAAIHGHIELIQRLVQQCHCDISVTSTNSWSPLHCAAAYNRVDAIRALCALGCKTTVCDAVGSTPLHVAAGEGNLEAIHTLIELGCDPCWEDRDGCTPLYCAAAWNRIDAVRALEKLGCSSSIRSSEGRTPLHVAAEQGWTELIDVLVTELGNAVDEKDSYQYTPLHSAASGGHPAAIRRLVELGHTVDARDYLGRTPLHYAVMHGRTTVITALIELGASFNEREMRNGHCALDLAAEAGQCESIARLIELGAPINGGGPSTNLSKFMKNPSSSLAAVPPLGVALMKGPANIEAMTLLVELGAAVDKALEEGNIETPLHVAARCGRVDIIDRLLRCKNVCIDWKTKDGSSPLHYAAAFGQTHAIEPLVKAGCQVDARDNASNTPMHLAAGCGFLDTVVKLQELGADINARDCTDCTPLQNAAHGTYSALAAVPTSSPGSCSSQYSGYGRYFPHHQPQLTAAQAAAQAALTASASSSLKRDGMMPVRTGLAWSQAPASLPPPPSSQQQQPGTSGERGGQSQHSAIVGVSSATAAAVGSKTGGYSSNNNGGPTLAQDDWSTMDGMTTPYNVGGGSFPSMSSGLPGTSGGSSSRSRSVRGGAYTQDVWSMWKNLGLTQVLKKAYKQQQKKQQLDPKSISNTDIGIPSGNDIETASLQQKLQQTHLSVEEALNQMQAALQRSQASLQQQLLQQLQIQQGKNNDPNNEKAITSASVIAESIITDVAQSTSDIMPMLMSSAVYDEVCDRMGQHNADPLALGGGKNGGRSSGVAGGVVLDGAYSTATNSASAEHDRSRLIDVVDALVRLGADLNAMDNEGRTALHLAAGCGDRSMVLCLLDHGMDINSKDSVGGTAMHHAAMANKKDMMFSLARLGCDWRSKADGIDGATASFVLCGQHSKSSRQQRLLDAKLKRMYQEGATARAAGRNPLADQKDNDDQDDEGADLEAEQAMADAAMAALLQEMEAEEAEAERKARKKKKKKKIGGVGAGIVSQQQQQQQQQQHQGKEDAEEVDTEAKSMKAAFEDVPMSGNRGKNAESNPNTGESSATAVRDGDKAIASSSAHQEESLHGGDDSSDNDPAKEVRVALDAAADAAAHFLAETDDFDEEMLEDLIQELDDAIDNASMVGISVKYGKKVRKKLQTALDRAHGIFLELTPRDKSSVDEPLPSMSTPPSPSFHHSSLATGSSSISPAKLSTSKDKASPVQHQHHHHSHNTSASLHASKTLSPSTFVQGMQPAMLPPQQKSSVAMHNRPSHSPIAPPPPPPPPPPPLPRHAVDAAALSSLMQSAQPQSQIAGERMVPSSSYSQARLPAGGYAALPSASQGRLVREHATFSSPSATALSAESVPSFFSMGHGNDKAIALGTTTTTTAPSSSSRMMMSVTNKGLFDANILGLASDTFGVSSAPLSGQIATGTTVPLSPTTALQTPASLNSLFQPTSPSVAALDSAATGKFTGLHLSEIDAHNGVPTFMGQDLRSHFLFGDSTTSTTPTASTTVQGSSRSATSAIDPGTSLLSFDLLDELDGVSRSDLLYHQHALQQQHASLLGQISMHPNNGAQHTPLMALGVDGGTAGPGAGGGNSLAFAQQQKEGQQPRTPPGFHDAVW